MKLSIIIPLYNKEKYIDRCVKSLLQQNLPSSEYEIIIIDDGSTDSSYEVAGVYEKKYNNICLFQQKNGGAGAARNKGLELARGKYVYFLDADDYIAQNVLRPLIDLSETNNLEVLGFNTKHTSDETLLKSSTQKNETLEVNVMNGLTFISELNFRNEAWWYIIDKSFLLNTGIKFTEGRYIQDSIFTASLFLKINRISKVNFDVHRFVQVQNSATTNKKSKHLLKFIDDLVYAIEQFEILINEIDISIKNYDKIVKVYKAKQQSFVFTILIKSYRCHLLKIKDLNKILNKLKKMNLYPINMEIGGIGSQKTSFLYSKIVVPVFNNKALLYLSLYFFRFFSSLKIK